jgi:vitamin B12 transporter
MKTSFPIFPNRLLVAGAFLACAFGIVAARAEGAHDTDAVALSDYVVTAARTAQQPHEVASSVTVITPGELAEKQITTLTDALRAVPGVSVLQTGGAGGVTSLLVRGSKAAQTLFLVDGVRFNDTNTSYASWLGGFAPGANDRIEVLRGPQSTLYGGAAMGGVISVGLIRGVGAPRGSVMVEGGSFNTLQGALSTQGADGALAWSFGAAGYDTDNDRPDNEASLRNYAARLDYRVSPALSVGGTFRYLDSAYRDPNDIRTFNTTPISNNDLTSNLTTLFAEITPGAVWAARVTAGWQTQHYNNDGSFSGFPSPYRTDSARRMIDWQNTLKFTDAVTVVAGANYERSKFYDGANYPDDTLSGLYGQVEWAAADGLHLGAGMRYDDYDSFGDVVTGRLTVNHVLATGTRLHVTYGTSFVPPSLSQRYGSAYTAASPGIAAESSTGWDAGIEQTLIAERLTLDVTWFHNTFKNLIAYQGAVFPALGNFRNIGRAEATGIETALKATLCPQMSVTLTWTYLDATDEMSGARLDDRPRHTYAADISWKPVEAWSIGVGWHGVADRLATDFNAFPSVHLNPGDYIVGRLYARYAFSEQLSCKARVENLLNRDYEETYGFPANGAAVYVGVEWTF